MEIGTKLHGFTLQNVRPIEDVHATLYEFLHEKSGGRVEYLACEDPNCVMAIGFRTLPEDSTGVCHIIEHSTLCGSKKYPLKEPFVNLLKTSVATFLNAFTANDWTMYPCASATPKDFDNIMSVYLDAVFNPKSMEDPRPFLQEGWHVELLEEEGTPCYKGVVYNEMKGAMSSVHSVLNQKCNEAMYPDSPYRHNSGGEPADIPNLTYEAYKAFYKAHYNPQNAMLLLYGKMDVEPKLAFIDAEYYSRFEKGEPLSVPKQSPVVNLEAEGEYEVGPGEPLKDNSYVQLCYEVCDYGNAREMIAWQILEDALMGEEGSPLKKALMDRHLGNDVYTVFDDDNIAPSLSFCLDQTSPAKKEAFYHAVEEEVAKIVEKGIDPACLIASLNHAEYKHKEADMGGFPKGIVYAMSMMGAFDYGCDLGDALEANRHYEALRKEIGTGYFENLLRKRILESDHKALVIVNPSATLSAEKKKAMDEKMAALKASLTPAEKKALVAQTKDLLAYQAHKDTPKELSTLPGLKRKDIGDGINFIETKKAKVHGIKTMVHPGETNGIAYANLYFDLSALTKEDLPYLAMLVGAYSDIPTAKHDLGSLANEIKTYLGDLSFSAFISSLDGDALGIGAYATVRVGCLKENVGKAVELIEEILFHSKFPSAILKNYLARSVNDRRMELMRNGMAVAMAEASSEHVVSSSLSSYVNGVNAYFAAKDMLEHFDIASLKAHFKDIIAKVYRKKNCVLSLTGNDDVIASSKEAFAKLHLKSGTYPSILGDSLQTPSKRALAIPAEINYNALVGHVDPKKVDNGHCAVLQRLMVYDYLWNKVRVEGGAYGCRFNIANCGAVSFGSYRDPNVKGTYANFLGAADYLDALHLSKKEFGDYVISALGDFDKPTSIRALSYRWDMNNLLGTSKKDLLAIKKSIKRAKIEDIKAFAPILREAAGNASCYSIGNEPKIQDAGFQNVAHL